MVTSPAGRAGAHPELGILKRQWALPSAAAGKELEEGHRRENHSWLCWVLPARHRKPDGWEPAVSLKRNDWKITWSFQPSPSHYNSVLVPPRDGEENKRRGEKVRKKTPTQRQEEIHFFLLTWIISSLILPPLLVSLRPGRLIRTGCGQCPEQVNAEMPHRPSAVWLHTATEWREGKPHFAWL